MRLHCEVYNVDHTYGADQCLILFDAGIMVDPH